MFRILCPDCNGENLVLRHDWKCLDCNLRFTDDDIPEPVSTCDADDWPYPDTGTGNMDSLEAPE